MKGLIGWAYCHHACFLSTIRRELMRANASMRRSTSVCKHRDHLVRQPARTSQDMLDSHYRSKPPHRTTIAPTLIRRNNGTFWGKNTESRCLDDFWREMAK